MDEAEKHALQIIPKGTSLMKIFWLRQSIHGNNEASRNLQFDSRIHSSLVEYNRPPKVSNLRQFIGHEKIPRFSETDRYFRSLFNFLSSEYKRIGAKKNFDFVSLMLANQIPDEKAQAMDRAPLSGQFVVLNNNNTWCRKSYIYYTISTVIQYNALFRAGGGIYMVQ